MNLLPKNGMTMTIIDLRSDTVTKPSLEMRRAIFNAEVGDDVFEEDPTVHQLEKISAELFEKEKALFVSSGTQANLISVLCHCNRGEEYIAGQNAHVYKWEGGGCAVLGGVQPQPIPVERDGTLLLDNVQKNIKPLDVHFAKTKLLALENTMWGKVLPLDYIADARLLADKYHLKMHLDGARVFNAAVALGKPVSAIAKFFDTISFCLSKGLGAPVGSLICGSAETIEKARHLRKMLGGGMRQAGVLAAAGIYALQNNINRLAEDHLNAFHLANELRNIPLLNDCLEVNTNIVLLHVGVDRQKEFVEHLKTQNILTLGNEGLVRFVTHLDIQAKDIERTIQTIKKYFA